jgi:hypothetical protein
MFRRRPGGAMEHMVPEPAIKAVVRLWRLMPDIETSFRDGPKDQTRNLEIPGSMLRIAPE